VDKVAKPAEFADGGARHGRGRPARLVGDAARLLLPRQPRPD
jgi:hypothetical protein